MISSPRLYIWGRREYILHHKQVLYKISLSKESEFNELTNIKNITININVKMHGNREFTFLLQYTENIKSFSMVYDI